MSRLLMPALLVITAGPLAAQPTGAGTVPQENRGETDIARRFAQLLPSIRAALAGNNAEAQRASLAVIETSPPGALFAVGVAVPLRAYLSRDIADPTLLALALRALGKSSPNGKDISDLIAKHVRAEQPSVRLAVAEAIKNAIEVAAGGRTTPSVAYLGELAASAKPTLEILLKDGDSASRRAALEAMQIAATRFGEMYLVDTGVSLGLTQTASELMALVPRLAAPDWEDSDMLDRVKRLNDGVLEVRAWASSGRLIEVGVRALVDLGPSLAPPLTDPDPATRGAALRALAAVGKLRRAVRPASGPVAPVMAVIPDPRLSGFVTGMGELLKSSDPELRLAAVSALEYLTEFPEAGRLLRGAVADRSVAVRWTVARSLRPLAGSKRPVDADIATLARLATDVDLDVRSSALVALEKHGPAGAAATAAVLRAARIGDVEPRLVAIKTLTALNSEAPTTVPVLIDGLQQEDIRLRRAAAGGLVRFRADARPALPELRRALQSPDPELRVAAAEAVLAIERQPKLSEER